MLWLLLVFLALSLAALTAVYLLVFGRARVPDYFSPEGLKKAGALAGAVEQARAWLSARETEEVWTDSDDGLRLHGLYVPAEHARGTVILFHSFRSSWKLDFAALFPFLGGLGYTLLLVDERAHARSGGGVCTYGLWERYDVRAWVEYADDRMDFPDHPIYLAGFSMGAAAVLMAASLELPGNVRGILADSAYTSPRALFEHVASEALPLPKSWTTAVLDFLLRLRLGVGLADCDTTVTLSETDYSVLFLHGKADRTVPWQMTQRAYEACAGEAEVLYAENAGHGMAFLTERERAERAIAAFLEKHRFDWG